MLLGVSLKLFAQATDQPVARTDANSKLAHEQMLANLKKGRIDVYFEGDSITRRWRATDYPQFLANWNENFHGWNAANYGWGADNIQNILWRLAERRTRRCESQGHRLTRRNKQRRQLPSQ